MKSNMLRKSGFGLLVAAGMMVPMASFAEDGSKYGHQATGSAMESDQGYIHNTFGEGTLYQDLQRLQSAKGWTTADRGAQGPIRTDSSMEYSSSAGEGTLYQDLQKLQSSQSLASTERGAQGPIRTETMDASPEVSDLYDGRRIYK